MVLNINISKAITKWVYSQRNARKSISDREIVDRLERAVVSKQLYLQPSLTLNQMSREIAVNRTYMTRALKSIDTNFKDYINSFRIQYAFKLLMDRPDYSTCEVAELSGFGTLKTMDLCMKKTFGSTSSNIRKRSYSMK